MPAPDVAIDRAALLRSIAVTAVVGALGVVWGIASGSQMILLDGVYAFVGIVMSGLLLRASAVSAAGPTRRYPYGREAATPLAIGIQGFVLLATLLYALVEAVFTIVDGGSDVTAGVAIAISTVASIVTWRWLQRSAGTSDVLIAEAAAWRVGAMRGAGMLVGFTALWLVTDTGWDRAGPYIDPVMVVVMCAAFLGTPVAMVRSTIIELLEGAPSEDLQAPVHAAVQTVLDRHDATGTVVRMTKVGPKLYVEVDADVDPSLTVGTEAQVRREITAELSAVPLELWLNVELHPRA
jgi:cation diffusion facilitator family transporter